MFYAIIFFPLQFDVSLLHQLRNLVTPRALHHVTPSQIWLLSQHESILLLMNKLLHCFLSHWRCYW